VRCQIHKDARVATSKEVVGFGNCFWERTGDSVKIIPILSVEKVIRTPQGLVQGYRQSQAYGGGTLKPDDIVHFRWNPVNGEAFGTGLLRTLLESLRVSDGETRLSFAEMKARMQKAMIDHLRSSRLLMSCGSSRILVQMNYRPMLVL